MQSSAEVISRLDNEAGIPCKAELGSVFGHGAGSLPPCEELYATSLGITDADCVWLSIAVRNTHRPVSAALRDKKKQEAAHERASRLFSDNFGVAGDRPLIHGREPIQ